MSSYFDLFLAKNIQPFSSFLICACASFLNPLCTLKEQFLQWTRMFHLTLTLYFVIQVQIDASLLQQLQQNGFITINPNGIQPNITADLSQVGGEIGANIVLSGAAPPNVNENGLISQQSISGTNEVLMRHPGLQDTDG